MDNMLIVTVGISGSGKSTLCKELVEDGGFVRICPDDIRKEFTGSISDQSQNGRVWREAYVRLEDALKRGENVVFDSIGTTRKTRNELRAVAERVGVPVAAYVLMDSLSAQRCRDRVAKDLENGVDRSNTLVDDDIIARQHAKFIETLQSIEDEGFDDVVRVG
jgi:predicted kinase